MTKRKGGFSLIILLKNKYMKLKSFTFIQVLIGLGIVAIFAAIIIVIISPAQQFSRIRDSQRWSDINLILNAINQRIVDNKGSFNEGGVCDSLPTMEKLITSIDNENNIDLCACLVPDYLSLMPYDPLINDGYTDCHNYNSGYTIFKNEIGKITIASPSAELNIISITR